MTLRARGYEVRAFASGAHALAEPSALQATCLITDHHMAEMTGEDLLLALRKAGWHRPAILLTTQRADYLQQQQQALFADVLQKPILEHRLCTCVDHATKEC
ncbi:response regulator [Sphingobium scionense]|uniref:Response regulator n=1 Tax=Sphingobium yanoikuyae TaxID=13690 RepID=A0A6P1GDT2_SPHYA|nr:response regulator [Sphingobium yanoikuyae]